MNLKSYYDALPKATYPKTDFVRVVSERSGRTTETVRNWIQGRAIPKDPEHLKILSEEAKMPIESLFEGMSCSE